MKQIYTLICLLTFNATGFAQISKITIKDQSVSAVFFSVDNTGCFETLVGIDGGFFVSTDNGTTTATPLVSALFSIWDNCTNSRILFAEGTGSQFNLKIDANLKTASLKATGIPLWDETHSGTIYADVDLVWSPTGKNTVSVYNDAYTEGGVTVSSHATGTIRPASATGSVMLQGQTTNFSPLPSLYASL